MKLLRLSGASRHPSTNKYSADVPLLYSTCELLLRSTSFEGAGYQESECQLCLIAFVSCMILVSLLSFTVHEIER
jgi:hypothetical protein